MHSFASSVRRSGFSLFELVVVLAVLGILATIAVPRAGGALDARRERASREGMKAIEEAVLGGVGQRGLEGFYADMGRLPRATLNADGEYSLRELWECPSSNASYRIVAPAADPDVRVGIGWRGPYLDIAGEEPVDGWNRPYTDSPDATEEQRRLVLGANGAVEAIRRRNEKGDVVECSLKHERETVLVVTVQALDQNGAASVQDLGTVTVSLYQPAPEHPGRIDVVEKMDTTATAVRTVRFDTGLLPGRRVLRVRSSRFGAGPVREIELRSEENHIWQAFTVRATAAIDDGNEP